MSLKRIAYTKKILFSELQLCGQKCHAGVNYITGPGCCWWMYNGVEGHLGLFVPVDPSSSNTAGPSLYTY